MEHNPLLSFQDGLEITYSDLKKNRFGDPYVTLYFERPNHRRSGFDSAQLDYPGQTFEKIEGFSKADLDVLMGHVKRNGHLALEFSKEDAECQS